MRVWSHDPNADEKAAARIREIFDAMYVCRSPLFHITCQLQILALRREQFQAEIREAA